MLYIKWFLLAISGILLKYLIAFPLTPLLVLLATKENKLPSWLAWFDTFDATLDGDEGWINGTRPYKEEKSKYQRYVNRCYWLWRNSLYGFSRSVVGYKHYKLAPKETMKIYGDLETTNTHQGHSGSVSRKLYVDDKLVAWQYFRVSQWGNSKKCTRLNIGWKLWDGQGDVSMICHSYTPYKDFGDQPK